MSIPRVLAYDCECMHGFFYAAFYDGTTFTTFDHTQLHDLAKFVRFSDILIGYNSFAYDDLMLRMIIKNPNVTTVDLKALNDRIITKGGRLPDDLFKMQYAPFPWQYSIDMYQIVNKKGSLKEWECRQHHTLVVDTPVDFTKPLPPDMIEPTKRYCQNDVLATWALYQTFKEQVKLRTTLIEMFDLGVRPYCLGDAGIAQAIFIKKYSDRTGGWSTTARSAAQKSPDNTARVWRTSDVISPRVRFLTPEFQTFFTAFTHASLVGDSDGTSWSYANGAFKDPITLGSNQYQIGVGGLHSVDAPGRFKATKDVAIFDLDVTSYYPSLIIEEGIYPKHIGPAFVEDYRTMRDMRVAAKKKVSEIEKKISELEVLLTKATTMKKSEILAKLADLRKDLLYQKTRMNAIKLSLNSTFGKFNDAYSPLRSIPSALRVTISGQLQLLMLIERLGMMGARILSANTDGVTFMWHRKDAGALAGVIDGWQKATKHRLERVEYQAYARRDVNSYCALKPDGKVKTKGAFEQAPLNGKTDERIVKQAAMDYLMKRVPLHVTVSASSDIRDFVYYQRTKGGSLFLGDEKKPIGRTARWYVPKEGPVLRSIDKNGRYNTVGNGARCALIMRLPETVPHDLDRTHYIAEARRLVESITKRRIPCSA